VPAFPKVGSGGDGGLLVLASVVSALFAIESRNKEAVSVAARNNLAKKNTDLDEANSSARGRGTRRA
jgi:hypothetical protein